MTVFGEDFRFGVATAAYQIEGAVREDGRGESIWDRFCRVPGAVVGGDTGDVACDHYHRHREDLDLMRSLGVESYRFSVAWPRVVPAGSGAVNQAGLDWYRRLAEDCLARGIEPIATLYHWDLPQALQDRGGWASRDTAERFAEYAAAVADALGDLVGQWITHNEPWCQAFLGYAVGSKAPGLRDWRAALAASHHLLLSHGLALPALRSVGAVGIALNLAPTRPATDADLVAASHQDGYLNRWFLDPVFRGAYPADMLDGPYAELGFEDVVRDGDLALISAPVDFLGVNYYNPMRVQHGPDGPLHAEIAEPELPTTFMGWEVDAGGLRAMLVRLRDEYIGNLPVYITENGASYDDPPVVGAEVDDAQRASYLEAHLEAVRAAIGDGVNVRRYCVWSFLDNFEWEEGYAKRFGIVHVDYETQERVVKRSGRWYRDYIRAERAVTV